MFLAVIAFGVAFAMSGCATTPAPRPSPADTVTPAAIPSASPTPVEQIPASIRIGAEATEILDRAGKVLVSLRYSEDGDAAVAAATAVLGEPEGIEHTDVTPHQSAMDGTRWGGFGIWVVRYSAEYRARVGESDYLPEFTVQATADTTASGVAVAAVDGTAVGEQFETRAAGMDPERVYVDESFGFRSVAVDLPTSFPGITGGATYPTNAYGVIASTDVNETVIEWISAPVYLWSET